MIQRSNDVVAARSELTNAFLRGVYVWMAGGLLLTALMAWATINTSLFYLVFSHRYIYFGLLIAELALVFILSANIHRLSSFAATAMFVAYSVLNGVTLSAILYVYTRESVFTAFVTTAGMFGAISLYGLVTKRDLSGIGSFMMMGLFGIIIAMIANFFIGSGSLDLGISIIGVIIFVGLTAYDTQKYRNMGASAPMDDALAIRRGTIIAALNLYLDFINMFLFILRLFGDRR